MRRRSAILAARLKRRLRRERVGTEKLATDRNVLMSPMAPPHEDNANDGNGLRFAVARPSG